MRSLKDSTVLLVLIALVGCSIGPDEATRLSNAKQSLAAHDYRVAMIELKSVLQDNPDNGEARRLLGEAYLLLGDGASAEKELLRAQQLGVDKLTVSLLLANAFRLQNKLDEALKWTVSPDGADQEYQAQVALMRGDILTGLGKTREARGAYYISAMASPQSEWSQISAVKLLLMDNKIEKAAKQIELVAQRYSDSVDVWLLKGSINRGLADHAVAEASFGAALKATGTAQFTQRGFQARLGIIQAALAQADLVVASEHIGVLLKQLPQHPAPKYFDALIAFQDKDYEKAQARLLQVLKVTDKHLPSQLLMGATQFALGQYEQASLHLTQVVNAIPTHLQARKMLAAVHMKLKSPLEAVKVLEPVVSDESASAELLAMVGQAALSAGDMSGSEQYLNRALKQGESAALRSELAQVYLAKGEFDGAISEFEKITGNDALQARVMIALTQMRKGDAARALTVAKELAIEYPEEVLVDVLLGGIYLTQGSRDKARISYLDGLSKDQGAIPALLGMARLDAEDGRLVEAESYFNQVLLADDANLRAFFGLAQIAERNNDLDQALSWVERARNSNPELIEPVLILARYYMRAQQYGAALKIVMQGIEARPKEVVLQRLNARIRFEQGDGAEAVEILKRAMALNPAEVVLVMELATMQRELGGEEQARQTLSKGLQASPEALNLEIELIEMDIAGRQFVAAHNRIESLKKNKKSKAIGFGLEGNLNMAQEGYPAAAKAYQQALDLAPSYVFLAKMMQAKHKLGRRGEIAQDVASWLASPENLVNESAVADMYMQLGENSRAIEHYEAVIERNSAHVVALNNLGWLYHQKGDARALITARRAYELAPNTAEVVDTLGWLLYEKHFIEEAVSVLRDARNLAPANTEIVLHLAKALASTSAGKAEAQLLIRQLIDEKPDLIHRVEVKMLLE